MAQVLHNTRLTVWDECIMAHKVGIAVLSRALQGFKNSINLIGGVMVLLTWDFRQTLPAVPRGS